MIIKFQIIKSLIREAFQSTTYLKGQMDRLAQGANNALVASETGGDEALHERVFTSDFHAALEMLKTIFADYLVPTSQTIGDNAIYYNEKTDNIVEFTLSVSKRFNGSLTDALARLCAKYAEDYVIMQWWIKTTNVKQAEPYQAALAKDEIDIRRCFVLSAPKVPTMAFPTTLTAKVDGTDAEGEITMRVDEDATVSYSIDAGAVDDIEARSGDPSVVEIVRDEAPKTFVLVPRNTGVAEIRLFSRHTDNVYVDFTVIVAKEYY